AARSGSPSRRPARPRRPARAGRSRDGPAARASRLLRGDRRAPVSADGRVGGRPRAARARGTRIIARPRLGAQQPPTGRASLPLVPFQQLMADAERGGYAVGYFESWNLESLQGVVDAAEAAGSPVIVGFSGINLPDPRRAPPERLELYAALGRAACDGAGVP